MKEHFDVTGMTCAACSARVDKSVRKVSGVREVNVNLLQNSMSVEGDFEPESVVRAVEQAGYGAKIKGAKEAGEGERAADVSRGQERAYLKRFVISLCILIPLMYVSMGQMLGLPYPSFLKGEENAGLFLLVQFLLVLPILILNGSYFKDGLRALFHGAPNMFSLIAVGAGAAFLYGVFGLCRTVYALGHADLETAHRFMHDVYLESAGMIVTLITLGKFLEAKSKGRTASAIAALVDLTPKTAVVRVDGEEREIAFSEIKRGDLLIVRAGASIAADGVVESGSGAVNEAALTGESLPAEKQEGSRVHCATTLTSGYLEVRAEQVGEDTAFSKVIALVEEASASKAPIARLADRVSGVFVPIVMGIALIAFVVWLLLGESFDFALSIGIAVLVVSCPCALGLATPTAIMVGTGKGAEYGILLKTGESIERLGKVDTFVLDKTGTVTTGSPEVCKEISLLPSFPEIAAALERMSDHPLAKAVIEYFTDVRTGEVKGFETVEGGGLRGKYGGKTVLAGNVRLMQSSGIDLSPVEAETAEFAASGITPLYFAQNGRLAGVLGIRDAIREDTRQAVAELKARGLKVVMLTGDHSAVAQAVAAECGIDEAFAELLPSDKEKQIRALQNQGRTVAMVGDGINDAPALTRADVGVAIGAGTDVALDSADVVLMGSSLSGAVTAYDLSRSVMRNIKQNLFWAFFYNSIGIPLAAGVFLAFSEFRLTPMFGALAMSLSSVCVVTNALRLKLFRPKHRVKSDISPVSVSVSRPEAPAKEVNMDKTIYIEGMACGHCSARVEKALNAIPGVRATVDLDAKCAHVVLTQEVSEQVLRDTVEAEGYTVTDIA